jgi:hypothetical protein
MSVGRMVAVLAVALSFGAIVAVLADSGEPAAVALWAAVGSLVAALAIAALLTGLVAIVRVLLGSPARPPNGMIAAALVVGGLVTFPVYSNFYEDASLAAVGGGVGYCGGVVPLSQVAYYSVADEPYARVYYFASCDD